MATRKTNFRKHAEGDIFEMDQIEQRDGMVRADSGVMFLRYEFQDVYLLLPLGADSENTNDHVTAVLSTSGTT